MNAIEFKTYVNDGIINVPKEYLDMLTPKVKVILLTEEESVKLNRKHVNTQNKSDLLLPPTIDTRGWKWNREEANER